MAFASMSHSATGGTSEDNRSNAPASGTAVTIDGEKFLINGMPTYRGRTWNGHSIEGLLLNSRMVQAIFDDLNPETRQRWTYPDTNQWDANRNTTEFLAAMPEWRAHGLLGITVNLQGGSPEGYSRQQPWENSAIAADGSLREAYMRRLERVLDRADDLGMVVILGIFYFGQDQRLTDEQAVIRAVDATLDWLTARGYRHVMIEINNESNVGYDHEILKPDRVVELIRRVKAHPSRFLVSTSFGGGTVPPTGVIRTSDYVLLHGNGVDSPAGIKEMVEAVRADPGYQPKPILFDEDDHFAFDAAENNFLTALTAGCGWGYFDFRKKGEGFSEGFQSVPVDWSIGSDRKRGFFQLLRQVTGEGH